jgi:hypothetical protein
LCLKSRIFQASGPFRPGKAGFIERVQRKTPAGDWGANTYVLDGLIAKIKALEPDFAKEREEREEAREKAETPRSRRPKN